MSVRKNIQEKLKLKAAIMLTVIKIKVVMIKNEIAESFIAFLFKNSTKSFGIH